jgi:hypothetical protein
MNDAFEIGVLSITYFKMNHAGGVSNLGVLCVLISDLFPAAAMWRAHVLL